MRITIVLTDPDDSSYSVDVICQCGWSRQAYTPQAALSKSEKHLEYHTKHPIKKKVTNV